MLEDFGYGERGMSRILDRTMRRCYSRMRIWVFFLLINSSTFCGLSFCEFSEREYN